MKLDWQTASYPQLSQDQLFEIFKLRQAIFIIEQNCPYPDIDQTDKQALHLCAWEAESLRAYARIIGPGISYSQASIGRVATSIDCRGSGLGRVLMLKAIDVATKEFPEQAIKIGAQQRLEAFYNSLGFATVSAPYDEDGIMHIHMLKQPEQTQQ